MSSEAMTENDPEQEMFPGGWQSPREAAPSRLRADEPLMPRWIGMFGLCGITLWAVTVAVAASGRQILFVSWFISKFISPNLAILFLILGIAGLLFHAARDAAPEFRRTYGFVGYVWLLAGVIWITLAVCGVVSLGYLPLIASTLVLPLLFLLAFLRHETETNWQRAGFFTLGGAGALLAGGGLIGGNISENFLLPHGLLLGLVGLLYLWAFVGMEGTESVLGYRSAQGLSIIGALVAFVAMGRSLLPSLFFTWHWLATKPDPYFIPSGLLLTGMGLLYLGLAVGIISENRLVVMTRRELAAFFFSPVAYIVLFSIMLVGFGTFWYFLNFEIQPLPGRFQTRMLFEPVISRYLLNFWTIIALILVVPVLTMRLLSEEKRTGTLEVLFTVPVGETVVVLSKFLATLIFFLLSFVPWGLYVVSFRVEGGQPFEYRPIFSAFLALAFIGANCLSMGLFFSSLTRNQIASALLTGVGMVGMTLIVLVKALVEVRSRDSIWGTILEHCSYFDLWEKSTKGVLAPQLLVFQASAAIFWLFLTNKVLESRKWL